MPFQRELRDLAYVPRWSIVRVAKPQSVAEHSYYTAMYADQIADMVGWRGPRDVLIRMALWHDVEECFTGDAPGPVKNRMRTPNSFDVIVSMMNNRFGSEWDVPPPDGSRDIVKAASLLDDALFLSGEIQRGNSACQAAWLNVVPRLCAAWLCVDPAGAHIPKVVLAVLRETCTQSMEPTR